MTNSSLNSHQLFKCVGVCVCRGGGGGGGVARLDSHSHRSEQSGPHCEGMPVMGDIHSIRLETRIQWPPGLDRAVLGNPSFLCVNRGKLIRQFVPCLSARSPCFVVDSFTNAKQEHN